MPTKALLKTEKDVVEDSMKSKKPTTQRDLITAKGILKQKSAGGDNVYDHLSALISKIIDERPKNVMDNFDELNRVVRMEKNRNPNKLLAATYVEPDSLKGAISTDQCIKSFFSLPIEPRVSVRVDDFMHLQFFWSVAGYSFPQAHVFALSCSLGVLQSKPFVRSCRYWGRIFGIKLNYYIAEAELTEDEVTKRASSDTGDSDDHWGSGINQRTYFVCHCLGDEWIELPKATTRDIEASQKIRKHFTGDLNASIQSNPKFTGTEQHLLRATIQRITTDAYAAPVGYYTMEEGNLVANTNYNPIESTGLLSLSSWCQHRKDRSPPCSNEYSPDAIPTWTIRHLHEQLPRTSMVLIRSNVWPGAVSFASKLENDSLYVGWGVTYSRKAFIPPLPLTTSNEYDFNVKAVNDEVPGSFPVKEAAGSQKE